MTRQVSPVPGFGSGPAAFRGTHMFRVGDRCRRAHRPFMGGDDLSVESDGDLGQVRVNVDHPADR